ncbi:hypothetical protein [Chitinophaga sp. CF418]|uniref:hypothetical protein n=1 Tax=Chitinophaga sp. CF418 TaxID=1855287 RepID=UPI00091C9262|nr:hypothetical protein [Chitinophaga sp. CF418]SHN24884.1 hypothetical protein SAMN05216311_107288 [Chitinophaga sp. CF418]
MPTLPSLTNNTKPKQAHKFTMRSFLIICTLIFISIVVVKAFTGSGIKDSREVYFYIWDKPITLKQRVSKTWYGKADSMRVIHVDLICENDEHFIDTIPCWYTGNKIYFDEIDTTQHKLIDMSLSFEVSPAKGSPGFNEKLTVSFLFFFVHSTKDSPLSFAFERKEGRHFDLNMSKTDYPFITSSREIESTVLADSKD